MYYVSKIVAFKKAELKEIIIARWDPEYPNKQAIFKTEQ